MRVLMFATFFVIRVSMLLFSCDTCTTYMTLMVHVIHLLHAYLALPFEFNFFLLDLSLSSCHHGHFTCDTFIPWHWYYIWYIYHMPIWFFLLPSMSSFCNCVCLRGFNVNCTCDTFVFVSNFHLLLIKNLNLCKCRCSKCRVNESSYVLSCFEVVRRSVSFFVFPFPGY